jgi:hypothetical protein
VRRTFKLWHGASCRSGLAKPKGVGVNNRCFAAAPQAEPAALWRAVFALVEAAVGPQAGEAPIHVSARDDSSSLLPITARQSALFPGTAETGTATIRVLRLADALPAADIAARALIAAGAPLLQGRWL